MSERYTEPLEQREKSQNHYLFEIHLRSNGDHVTRSINRAEISATLSTAGLGLRNSLCRAMIRSIWTRPFSRLPCKRLSTLSPPDTHGLLPTSQSPITPKPHFFNAVTTDGNQLPTYRIIDGVGNIIEGAELPEVCSTSLLILTDAYCHASWTNNWRGECPCYLLVPKRDV